MHVIFCLHIQNVNFHILISSSYINTHTNTLVCVCVGISTLKHLAHKYIVAAIDEAAFLSPVDFDDGVLIDVLEYVGGVHKDAQGSHRRDNEEDTQLQPVNHHGHKLPILSDLQKVKSNMI